jgi:hypothetical protein
VFDKRRNSKKLLVFCKSFWLNTLSTNHKEQNTVVLGAVNTFYFATEINSAFVKNF